MAVAKEAIALGAFDYTLKPVDFDYLGRALDKMLATVERVRRARPASSRWPPPRGQRTGLLYDLALEVFRTTRTLSAGARESIAPALESASLSLIQRGSGATRPRPCARSTRSGRSCASRKDLGDITDETHRVLESHMARARRSVGLT